MGHSAHSMQLSPAIKSPKGLADGVAGTKSLYNSPDAVQVFTTATLKGGTELESICLCFKQARATAHAVLATEGTSVIKKQKSKGVPENPVYDSAYRDNG